MNSSHPTVQAAIPTPDEGQRLAAVHGLGLLDSTTEERFERITRMARQVFAVPIALVSLVDAGRQWFKSHPGLAVTQTDRAVSLCGHAIHGAGLFIVPDARCDPRFADNPLVSAEPRIRFYAGRPLHAVSGHCVGTLCLIDHAPRCLTAHERALLTDLGGLAEQEVQALHLATLDDLTLLSNRRGFLQFGQALVEAWRDRGLGATLLSLRLDALPFVEREQGTMQADVVVCRFAAALEAAAGECGLIARTRADTFVALLPQPDDGAVPRTLQHLATHLAGSRSPHPAALRHSHRLVTAPPAVAPDVGALLRRSEQGPQDTPRPLD